MFADIMSEQMNYFLAFSKLARIQCVFWGNPITSGIDTIDYFMTADATENENTQIHTHYSEQAVLLGGQVVAAGGRAGVGGRVTNWRDGA